MNLLVPADGRHGTVEQIEIFAHFLGHRLEAARADHLQPRMHRAKNADLAFHQLRRGTHLQRIELPEFARMKIQRPRDVALPDANLPYGKLVYVKKHGLFRTFKRKAIIRRSPVMSRKAAPNRAAMTRIGQLAVWHGRLQFAEELRRRSRVSPIHSRCWRRRNWSVIPA